MGHLEIYFARCGKRRAWIVAPTRARAYELAVERIGIPSRTPSLQLIEDELCIDPKLLLPPEAR